MNINFKEDENGRIADDDAIFDTLNNQIDNEEYDAVVSQITAIPREKWSLKLRFLLICAYNNQHDFKNAAAELHEATNLCETPNDKARYCYQSGYMYSLTGYSIVARQAFTDTMELDPEYAKSIDLESDIADCDDEIKEDLEKLHGLCKSVIADIKERCQKSTMKRKLSEEEFIMRLGFFSATRVIPGVEKPMGLDGYLTRLEGEDKAKTQKWLGEHCGITDTESFIRFIQTYNGCNIAGMVIDAAAYLANKPRFDINELDNSGKFAFGSALMLVDKIVEFLPHGGVLAWDISEKIGFSRYAYRCGLIPEEEFVSGTNSMMKLALDAFSGWEEYMCSLICGAAMFMFRLDQWSIKSAASFAAKLALPLVNSDLADSSWGAE